jgi:hypothetical protein
MGSLSSSWFFSTGDDADRLVCFSVWRVFIKDSFARGYASKRDLKLPWSGAPPAPLHDRPPTTLQPTCPQVIDMPKPTDSTTTTGRATYGSLREPVKASGKRLAEELGRPPTAAELHEALGGLAKSPHHVRLAAARYGVELSPMPKGRARKGGGGANAVPAPAPSAHTNGHATNGHAKRSPAADDAPPPSGGAGACLAIMALQEQRARIAGELAAIDAVIERLRR